MMPLIPQPVSQKSGQGRFDLASATAIICAAAAPELFELADYLAEILAAAVGRVIPVERNIKAAGSESICLNLSDGAPELGEEGYQLRITSAEIRLTAGRPAGLFYGIQTLRQLLPVAGNGDGVLPAVTIRDTPRFGWRGAMLDVSRHFFGVCEVKRLIDLLAYYKMNTLHLHLSDDQGWRLMIESWPRLATVGGSTAVGGDPGGYFTQAEYGEIVTYAQKRFITIVPEIDMPGHTHAALASYAELNCDDQAPPLYSGTEVGLSSFCIDKEITYRFIDQVVEEIAALTPGPYLHIGGDEAHKTKPEDYVYFINRVQEIVRKHGKQLVGWEEIAQADIRPGVIVQHWHSLQAAAAVKKGGRVIVSPATRAYLDMQYDKSTPIGLNWAGYVDVEKAYDWDPAGQVEGIEEGDIVGVEAPLWTETVRSRADLDYLMFPRLPGIAEIGWSPAGKRDWAEYRLRLAAHGPRLTNLGVNFYRAAEIPWPETAG